MSKPADSSTQPLHAGVGRPSSRAVAILRRVVYPLVRLAFRPTLEGLEHLPDEGPFLLVANHSAGLGLAELSSFSALYAMQVGRERPLAGFAHPIGFKVWPITAIHRHLGTIPSTYDAAYDTIDAGVPILVFPGGDHETMRPIWQANDVDFGGRRGFLRIARKAGIPIVPMGIRGSHYTAPVLLRSKLLAWAFVLPRLLGVKRWCITLLGVLGGALLLATPLVWWAKLLLVWLWLVSPLIFTPIIPWTVRFRIGERLPPDELFEGGDDEEALHRARERVEAEVQQLVL